MYTALTQWFTLFSSPGFYGTIIMLIMIIFAISFIWAQKKDELNWTHMITKPGTRFVSLTKVLQLIGGIVATWIMIKLTTSGTISWEIFATYLTYVASIEGYSKFIAAKYGSMQLDADKDKASKKDSKDE